MLKRHKYGAIKCEKDGHKFDSKAEARFWDKLRLRLLAKEIQELQVHPKFELAPKLPGIRAITYTPDFSFIENGKRVAIDVKGIETTAFRIKANLFKRAYPEIELRIVK